ncbi:hypothetical protein A1S_3510 [Acinetobacter baumannii ATCC 17978]|nr:hypothetical protein A1S_3510 [Acinetobacter baumannii ATCC 17978]
MLSVFETTSKEVLSNFALRLKEFKKNFFSLDITIP